MDTDRILFTIGSVASLLQAVEFIGRFVMARGPKGQGLWIRIGVLVVCCSVVLAFWPHNRGNAAEQHYQRARALFEAKNRPQAVEEAKQALAVEPTHVASAKLLGACYGIDGDVSESVAAYEKATRIDPEDIEARMGLGTALEASDRASDAVAVYRFVLRHPKTTAAQTQLAKVRLSVLASRKVGPR